jgi:hypothetical protein
LQLPPTSMWWQALVVGAAGAAGWLSGGIAFKLANSLPVKLTAEGISSASDLMSNVILSGLIGGTVLAVMYWLTHRSEKSLQ